MPAKMPQPLGGVFSVLAFAMRHGLLPGPEKALEKPHDERLKLFIHGGAFIDCGVDFCDNVQRGLAHRTGYVVVGLSYRLAPEHPFPAGSRRSVNTTSEPLPSFVTRMGL
jgi:hypothetical protein